MRTTKPFVVIQNGKPIFTVYAYSADQARALVAAKVAGEVIVAVTPRSHHGCERHQTEQADDPRHSRRPSSHGLRLSDAEGHQAQHGA